ncbi:transporter substrate-binding domain-containing protein [Burkholderia sp. Ax-1719]|uniref:transporter substrate-binding domain-containing protein n=1 Tax=Burkholderia sp. Ax-1719 TaxID=2608334 RepID=UPI00141DB1B9|nr:transporter substrate-binding domain-containing protein [Burkholderia sp. Ax-1719]NIE66059.1 transporter substrate-binding domain-containing protein [Burkholderia sp. Ax-1719]
MSRPGVVSVLCGIVVLGSNVCGSASAAAPIASEDCNATIQATPIIGSDAPGPAGLRVAIAPTAPFVLPQTSTPEGFSIDIWNEIARRIHRDFTWCAVAKPTDLLAAVEHGNADVAISAITMTPDREGKVDFSMPYFDSGLQILVRANSDNSLLSTLASVPWRAIGQFVGMTAAIVFVLANLVWLMERRRDRNFQKPYWRAIGEGLWITMLIIATGEHGERDAPGAWKRVLVPTMWLIGVLLVAQLTATVTSSQTVARLQSNIRDPDDLPGKIIGTLPGTVAAGYLTQRGLPFVNVTSAADGFQKLMQGDVQAIVYDAPTLQYWACRLGNGALAVVGPIFRPEKYGIALPNGSPLRKTVNEALLTMYEDGTYEQIHRKWFASGS